MVMPCMKCFCRNGNATMIGAIVATTVAILIPIPKFSRAAINPTIACSVFCEVDTISRSTNYSGYFFASVR